MDACFSGVTLYEPGGGVVVHDEALVKQRLWALLQDADLEEWQAIMQVGVDISTLTPEQASIKLQAWWRARQAKADFRAMHRMACRAVCMMQRVFRGYQWRKTVAAKRRQVARKQEMAARMTKQAEDRLKREREKGEMAVQRARARKRNRVKAAKASAPGEHP